MKKCPNCRTGEKVYRYILAEQKINGYSTYDFKLTAVAGIDDCFCKKCGWKGKTSELIEESKKRPSI
jgi:hypothetical protein